MTYEGTLVAKAAGIEECSIGNMPSWNLIKAAVILPQFLTRGAFKKNVKKMVMSSMAQDIIQNKTGDSELETINGQLLEIAERYKLEVPYNKKVYQLCKREFAKENFKSMDIKEVWQEIQSVL